MLVSLSEANHNKESEIFALNEKIKEASGAKEKILEKEKLFFEYTKSFNYGHRHPFAFAPDFEIL